MSLPFQKQKYTINFLNKKKWINKNINIAKKISYTKIQTSTQIKRLPKKYIKTIT